MKGSYKGHLAFNNELIELYKAKLEWSDKSQNKVIWSKIFAILDENVELYRKLNNYKRSKHIKPQPTLVIKKEIKEPTYDTYDNDREENLHDYEYERERLTNYNLRYSQ